MAPPFAAGALIGTAWWLGVHVLPDPTLFREQWNTWGQIAEPPLVALLKHPISWIAYDAGRILAPGLRSPGLVLTAGYWALFAIATAAAVAGVARRSRAVDANVSWESAASLLRDALTPAVFVAAFAVLLLLEVSQRLVPYYAYTIPQISATALLCTTILAKRWRLVIRAMAVVVAAASLVGMGYLTWNLREADYNRWTRELHRPIPAGSTVFGWQDLRFGFDDARLRGFGSYFNSSAPAGSYVIAGQDLLEAAPKDYPGLAKIIAERGRLIARVEDPVYGRNISTTPKQDTYTLIYLLK